MERERQQQQLYALVKEMNEALDRKRWRRLPGLHQQVMRVFHDYAAWETDATALSPACGKENVLPLVDVVGAEIAAFSGVASANALAEASNTGFMPSPKLN